MVRAFGRCKQYASTKPGHKRKRSNHCTRNLKHHERKPTPSGLAKKLSKGWSSIHNTSIFRSLIRSFRYETSSFFDSKMFWVIDIHVMIFNNKEASFLSEIAFKNIKSSLTKLQEETNDVVKVSACLFWVLAYILSFSPRRELPNDITFVLVEPMIGDPLWARDGPLSGSGRIVLSGSWRLVLLG